MYGNVEYMGEEWSCKRQVCGKEQKSVNVVWVWCICMAREYKGQEVCTRAQGESSYAIKQIITMKN